MREILRRAGATALLVTHDQAEALEISDRVAVMRGGRIEQISTPDELYLRPANRFVAGFVGEANLLPGEVRHGEVQTLAGSFRADDGALVDGSRAEVLLRPEQLHMLAIAPWRAPPRPETVLTVDAPRLPRLRGAPRPAQPERPRAGGIDARRARRSRSGRGSSSMPGVGRAGLPDRPDEVSRIGTPHEVEHLAPGAVGGFGELGRLAVEERVRRAS